MTYNFPFNVDGREYKDSYTLANYLATNFRKSLELIKNGSLFNFLQEEDPKLHEYLVTNVVDFEYPENILTLTIYMLDNNLGIVTKGNHFTSNYDIAEVMKAEYPNINRDAFTLFKDKVLALIFWNEYEKRNDNRYKRNYTFMLHIYENRMYDFTYFYYLFLHLSKNERIRFMIDGIKMNNVEDIPGYLYANYDRASVIIDEIIQNAFVLALIAIGAGIDTVSQALQSGNKYAILKPLAKISTIDLTIILKRRMSFWLLSNYLNYQYETQEAIELLAAYNDLKSTMRLETVADYLNVTDQVNTLYGKFVRLFNHNRIVNFRAGISASPEYYLSYRYNDEYVCEKYLVDNDLFDSKLHTDIYQLEVEREILVEVLEDEKRQIHQFRNDAEIFANGLHFEHKENRHKGFITSMMMILGVLALLAAYLLGWYGEGEYINVLFTGNYQKYVNYGLLGMLALSIIINVIATAKYNRLNDAYELIDSIEKNTTAAIKAVDEEERVVVNPPKRAKYRILTNLIDFKHEREEDLTKLKRISSQKTYVNRSLIVLGNILFTLPFVVIGLGLLKLLAEVNIYDYPYSFEVASSTYQVSIVLLGYFLLNAVLVILLRKKNFIYYLFYVLIGVIIALTFLL